MKYLLDTDTCIYALHGRENVIARLLEARRIDVCVSVITEGELRSGSAKSAQPIKTLHAVERFLAPISILPFDSDDARVYAQIRSRLERAGRGVGPLDTLIAAQGVAPKLTLVTSKQREFARIPHLRLENWAR